MFRLALVICLVLLARCQESDPNGINHVFHYLEKHPELVTSLIIKENQLISNKNGECFQYDYVYFEWRNDEIENPFPTLIDGREYCSVVKCDDVFGPAESVPCSIYF